MNPQQEQRRKDEDFEALTLAWLHDPPDKAASIVDHVSRAARYASAVLGRDVSGEELSQIGDQLASAYERMPMPPYGELRVSPTEVGQQLEIRHPLSGDSSVIHATVREAEVRSAIEELQQETGPGDPMSRFLRIWRRLPERLPDLAQYPADTRIPDHTIWQHLDTTAAIALAHRHGTISLLSFKLTPVQGFIGASRSLRDLLSGSYLLSALTFAAMEPVLERCGPTAFVYPALRGVPLMDHWLAERRALAGEVDTGALCRPSIPNRFLAIVPSQYAGELEVAIRRAFDAKWKATAGDVHRFIAQECGAEFPDWDRNWQTQIESYFGVYVTHFELRDAPLREIGFRPDGDLQRLAGVFPSPAPSLGLWQEAVRYSTALMEASTQIRHVPDYAAAAGVAGAKCTLFGTYEQMGPPEFGAAADAFHKRLAPKPDPGEENDPPKDRLCAVGLVKRFALQKHFRHLLRVRKMDDFENASTRDLAEACQDPKGTSYYAVLMMDGDEMGKWLSGEKSPSIADVLHPKAREIFERRYGKEIQHSRPVSPALHATISSGLTHFATRLAPEIVERHGGTLVYAGGDDVLAMLPMDHAVECAKEVAEAFCRPEALGRKASMSAGLVIAHEKEDLRLVLEQARAGEKAAKQAGRGRCTLTVMRRSGEHAPVTVQWKSLEFAIEMKALFRDGASDRWAYQLRRQLPVFRTLPDEAFSSELHRLLSRSDKRPVRFEELWSQFRSSEPDGDPRERFLTFVQSASFLTRGTDGGKD